MASGSTPNRAFILVSMEQPTRRFENAHPRLGKDEAFRAGFVFGDVGQSDLLLGTQPLDVPFAGGEAQFGKFVSDELIPKRRIISMHIEQRVDKLRLSPISGGDEIVDPFMKRLRGESQDPARHLEGNPHLRRLRSKFMDQREHYSESCARDRHGTARRIPSASCPSRRTPLSAPRNASTSPAPVPADSLTRPRSCNSAARITPTTQTSTHRASSRSPATLPRFASSP